MYEDISRNGAMSTKIILEITNKTIVLEKLVPCRQGLWSHMLQVFSRVSLHTECEWPVWCLVAFFDQPQWKHNTNILTKMQTKITMFCPHIYIYISKYPHLIPFSLVDHRILDGFDTLYYLMEREPVQSADVLHDVPTYRHTLKRHLQFLLPVYVS